MPVPFPVRFIDMRDAEARYQATDPDRRLELHNELPFHALLLPEERAALARRFPKELAGDPKGRDASAAVRVAWDFRCRELVVCMLHFGDEVLRRKLELVDRTARFEDADIMALTASGSILALDRPEEDDGARTWRYLPGVRRSHRPRDGKVILDRDVALGDRVNLGRIVASEVMVLASGIASGPFEIEDAAIPEGTALFTPARDTSPQLLVADEHLIEMTRFKVLVDAMGNPPTQGRGRRVRQALGVAQTIQERLADEQPSYPLEGVAELKTITGARYRLEHHRLRGFTDAERFTHGDTHSDTLEHVTIGAQRVVAGAPLVLLDGREDKATPLAVLFEVTEVTPR